MTSSRPYLIRAVHEWIVDNGLTPYILVNAEAEDVAVPREYVESGKIVLNISGRSVAGLSLGNELISFDARFAGTPMTIALPPGAVMAIYAKENGQGMLFSEDDEGGEPPPGSDAPGEDGGKKPNLKVVK
ncbi:MAG: ClpXP protease specificity-enhancing factor [Gammaproteobacteria bacterium]|nr:ClpXP protease specificity-enhancing factor [Gammaproteobacteria bacterium]NIR82243.1 ClpXP protease specificity-enhancing factor [Gammaproteobacteria bacterium]NIR91061.1 ClpXP protease specificity-enhancing factor [Gammaproteobacteria bacterium]NIU03392.1 ClpXP protease specificity-enhancing factor [Gammaproteobacteria bacterium]NIV50885.1 ClpXP protease specificity-enhancing factor [Gammaproteobacteria bacterium]